LRAQKGGMEERRRRSCTRCVTNCSAFPTGRELAEKGEVVRWEEKRREMLLIGQESEASVVVRNAFLNAQGRQAHAIRRTRRYQRRLAWTEG
jgi:hypothetical protein